MNAVIWQRPARRRSELGMILLVLVLTGSLYTLATLGKAGALPAHIAAFGALVFALMLAAHLALRRLAPESDPVLLPLAALLNGMGYVFITGIDPSEASAQATWTAIGVIAFVLTLVLFPQAPNLERYRYTIAAGGIALLVLPLLPHIGEDINGARLWVHIGPLSFQPEEFAKVALGIFFASVLAERADLLATGTRRIGRWLVLEPRYVAPLIAAWGVSLLILLAENDLGSSFLFFTLFVSLLWVATGRWAYLGLGAILFSLGTVFALDVIHHAQTRVQAWLYPWSHFATSGYQIIEGWFALAAGGLWGLGPGQGNPQVIPEASTDFIFASIGEEVGLVGLAALLIAYLLMVGSGLRTAVRSQRSFSKLLGTGLSLLLGVQVFVVVGGITRLIPITGITLPFVSYGGSSLVSNYILLAVLLRISNDNANEAALAAARLAPLAGVTTALATDGLLSPTGAGLAAR
ncbi:MAG TPA: FtsW/RodA/SpoVE family cell cycle protein [Acidimicrobiales bacterium]|nr:FtsW/RodA/SpoVE family cell cycle protein [Acidimicrobiales bacterium]